MAHLLVYLQRTPLGLHPASAVAACLARDVASARGAVVVGFSPGLSDQWDGAMERAAGRFGCDRLLFVGPGEVLEIVRRLRPVSVLVPWTTEGAAVAEGAKLGAPVPRRVASPGDRRPLDAVTAVAAGVLPWYDLPTVLEAEYTADAGMVRLPQWLLGAPPGPPPDFLPLAGPPFRVVGAGPLEPSAAQAAAALGASILPDPASIVPFDRGTLIWVDDAQEGPPLPADLDERAAATTVVAVRPSGHAREDDRHADWVLEGPAAQHLAALSKPPWMPCPGD